MRYTLKLFACFIFVLVGGASLLHANPPNTRFQAIIFDCDGVLVDTEYLKFLAWKEALETQGIPFSIEEYMPSLSGRNNRLLSKLHLIIKMPPFWHLFR